MATKTVMIMEPLELAETPAEAIALPPVEEPQEVVLEEPQEVVLEEPPEVVLEEPQEVVLEEPVLEELQEVALVVLAEKAAEAMPLPPVEEPQEAVLEELVLEVPQEVVLEELQEVALVEEKAAAAMEVEPICAGRDAALNATDSKNITEETASEPAALTSVSKFGGSPVTEFGGDEPLQIKESGAARVSIGALTFALVAVLAAV
ncbi:MAG: hypothetical protein SGCHY_003253 [Lobulomycetales sp.]